MTRIKICGLTKKDDIDAVNAAKPDYVGFVFAESRRRVTASTAASLRESLDDDITPVGVFSNETYENIIRIVSITAIDVIQLHGDEDEDYIARIKGLTGKTVIKAVSVSEEADVQKWQSSLADFILFDSKNGGSGKRFNWNLIHDPHKSFFLAGGLNIDNILEAIEKTKPFAVDVSGGVETCGSKDYEKISAFIGRVRNEQ